jgi:2-polyprenyl-3-methyl-5-hydroxy-6-metoxy-1,4-benzoquinol methylase
MPNGDLTLTEQQIRDRIRDLAPFHHPIDLPYGLNTFLENAPDQGTRNRLPSVMSHGWPALLDACGGSLDGLTVLDVACNCGGLSVQAAKSGAKHVLGFDVVDRYIEQANFVKAALAQEFPEIEFRKLNVEDLSPEAVGTFDVTLCFGILYHLQDPVSTMQRIASVTERVLFIGTKTYRPPSRRARREVDQSLWRMNIRTPDSKETTANGWVDKPKCQFEPTPRAVTDLLRFLGFGQITRPTKNRRGRPEGLFLAQR